MAVHGQTRTLPTAPSPVTTHCFEAGGLADIVLAVEIGSKGDPAPPLVDAGAQKRSW